MMMKCAVVSSILLGVVSAQLQLPFVPELSGNALPISIFSVLPTIQRLEVTSQFYVSRLITDSWWNSYVWYHPTGVDTLLNCDRKAPQATWSNENKNTAMLIANLRVYENLPGSPAWLVAAAEMKKAMVALGITVDLGVTTFSEDACMQTGDPLCIGNLVASELLASVRMDGMNLFGDAPGSTSKAPLADYTGFEAMNSPASYTVLTRWQPTIETDRLGYYYEQRHITPQVGRMTPYALSAEEVKKHALQPPYGSVEAYSGEKNQAEKLAGQSKRYTDQLKQLAQEVVDAGASLTDEHKMLTEWFDNKLISLAPAWIEFMAAAAAAGNAWSLDKFVQYEQITASQMDAVIVCWKEKIAHDAVRPVSVIHNLLGNPDWQPYMRTMPHSEFPSGTSCLCKAFVEYVEKFLAVDGEPFKVTAVFPKGSSVREPGMTPQQDITVTFTSSADFLAACTESRVNGGIHFKPATTGGAEVCSGIGNAGYDKMVALREGAACATR